MKSKILTFNIQDSDGYIFLPDSVDVNSKPILTRNFDLTYSLGKVDLVKDNTALYAIIDSAKYKGLYPAIGFQIIKSFINHNGFKVITDIKIYQIGLCDYPNIDPTIKPL